MNRRQSTMHQQLEQVIDLSTLSPVSEDIIVSCIRERFMTDNIYTNIGSSALVAVNPHKYVPSNSDAVLQKYAAEYRDTAPDKVRLPPHIFQLANNAYYHMRRTAQDQSILFTYVSSFVVSSPMSGFGVGGAGKVIGVWSGCSVIRATRSGNRGCSVRNLYQTARCGDYSG